MLLFRGVEEVVFFAFLYVIILHRSRDQSVLCKQEMITIFLFWKKKVFYSLKRTIEAGRLFVNSPPSRWAKSHFFRRIIETTLVDRSGTKPDPSSRLCTFGFFTPGEKSTPWVTRRNESSYLFTFGDSHHLRQSRLKRDQPGLQGST